MQPPAIIPLLTPRKLRHLRLLLLPIKLPQQPISHTDNPRHAIKLPSLLRMLYDVFRDLPLVIKLEDENPAELLRVT